MSKPPSISGRDSNAPKVDATEPASESQKPAGSDRKTEAKRTPSEMQENLRPARQKSPGKGPVADAATPAPRRGRKAVVRAGASGGASPSADPAAAAGASQPAAGRSIHSNDIRERVTNEVQAFIRKASEEGHLDDCDDRLQACVSVDKYRALADAAISTVNETARGARLAWLGARVADLTSRQRERFIEAVVGLQDEATKAVALAPLGVAMESLSDDQQGRLIDSAIGIKHERDAALAMAGLCVGIAYLAEPRRKRLVKAAADIKDEKYKALAMAGVGAGMAWMTKLNGTEDRDGAPERG